MSTQAVTTTSIAMPLDYYAVKADEAMRNIKARRTEQCL